MRFELIPIIDKMFDLYEKPRSMARFQEYISILQDKKGNMTLPIVGFNPMAKEHTLKKLTELKELKAEQVIQDTINNLNTTLKKKQSQNVIKVVLNLVDDLKGAWTNHYTTDYDSKFRINALVTRNFCTPFFWTSENYNKELIIRRTFEYALRTTFWQTNTKPKTLKEHIEQEIYVTLNGKVNTKKIDTPDFQLLDNFYLKNQQSEDYTIIFNFFYGDSASKSLEFPTYGITGELNGFDYARIIGRQRKTTT